jgi:hypothetical protein
MPSGMVVVPAAILLDPHLRFAGLSGNSGGRTFVTDARSGVFACFVQPQLPRTSQGVKVGSGTFANVPPPYIFYVF